MSRFRKKTTMMLGTAILCFCMVPEMCYASLGQYHVAKAIQADDISVRADAYEWRYKTENGKLYKRLYNRTKMEWAGEWILCK